MVLTKPKLTCFGLKKKINIPSEKLELLHAGTFQSEPFRRRHEHAWVISAAEMEEKSLGERL